MTTGTGQARQRVILHVDMDAFFAAVEVREDPRLRDRPVIVGADPHGGQGRGVVAAASYEARAFGVHSAMPIGQAYRCCPGAVFVRPHGGLYARVSRRLMAIFARYTDLVEPLSIDEAFLDVSASGVLFGDGPQIARNIKRDVHREEGLSASVGIAPCKFIAKIASDFDKPDGLVVVSPGDVSAFLTSLPVERLWGAGPKTIVRFHRMGVRTVGDLRRFSREHLAEVLGESLGGHFFALAWGQDERQVIPRRARKSIGREVTFEHDLRDRKKVAEALLSLLDEVTRRMRRMALSGHSVTVKLRTDDFRTVTRQAVLPFPADTSDLIWPLARKLLDAADMDSSRPIRLVGVSVAVDSGAEQLSLFPDKRAQRLRELARAVDAVQERYGKRAIHRGGSLTDAAKAGRCEWPDD